MARGFAGALVALAMVGFACPAGAPAGPALAEESPGLCEPGVALGAQHRFFCRELSMLQAPGWILGDESWQLYAFAPNSSPESYVIVKSLKTHFDSYAAFVRTQRPRAMRSFHTDPNLSVGPITATRVSLGGKPALRLSAFVSAHIKGKAESGVGDVILTFAHGTAYEINDLTWGDRRRADLNAMLASARFGPELRLERKLQIALQWNAAKAGLSFFARTLQLDGGNWEMTFTLENRTKHPVYIDSILLLRLPDASTTARATASSRSSDFVDGTRHHSTSLTVAPGHTWVGFVEGTGDRVGGSPIVRVLAPIRVFDQQGRGSMLYGMSPPYGAAHAA